MTISSAQTKTASTLELCAEFGPYARILPPLFDYTKAKFFSGPTMILKVSGGREKLNNALRKSCVAHVVVIDGRNLQPSAVVGPPELISATAGSCRALVVFGSVYGVGELTKEKDLPIWAANNSPNVLRGEGGRVEIAYLDCEAGLITNDFYITCDADGMVAIQREQMQAHYPVP